MSDNGTIEASKFFILKDSASKIDDGFDFLETQKQKLLDNGNIVSIKTGLNGTTVDSNKFKDYNRSMGDCHQKQAKLQREINQTYKKTNFGGSDKLSVISTYKLIKQSSGTKMYGSAGTLSTNYRQFDFMSQTLLEEEMKNLQEKEQKENQLKSKQQELYNRYKNVHISTQDIKELHKIINRVKSIKNEEKIKTEIKKYDAKYIKLLYLISKLEERNVCILPQKTIVDSKECKYCFFCNTNTVFNDIKPTQEAGNGQYIGLVFGKESKGNDIIKINNLINKNNSFESVINSLETEQTKLLTNQIDQCKSSITDLENQLKEIQQRKDELLRLK